MRKLILSVIFLLIFSSCAFSDAMIYMGNGNIGSVRTIDNASGYFVSVEDSGRLLGFTSSRLGEELILTKGNVQLRVIANSAAAWRGYTIIPLQSAPFEQDGNFWLDAQSTSALFQGSAGGGRLRFVKSSGSGNTTSAIAKNISRSEKEFGIFDVKEKEEEVNPPVKPLPVTPAPAIQIPSVQTQTVTPQPAITIPEVQTQPVITQTSGRNSGTKTQPRYETFKPDDRKTEHGENYSGTIQGIRWTMSEGAHRKIRAVVTTDENADPQVFMQNGELHALFASSLESSSGISSPYSNIRAEIKRNSEGTELVFTPTGITKAEKLVLSSPRRIAFEFFFPLSVNIVRVNPITNQTQEAPIIARTPEPPRQSAKTSEPRKTDPIININNQNQNVTQARTPAVKTQQTTITIPTIPVSTRRNISAGMKTIVIDAGHGGKDPGASDNGVVEKNVNLAIALELERELLAMGFNVVMTRRTDVYLKLQERADIANEVNADLFVSIHVNALPSKKSTTGIEVYIMALPTDKDAMNLAKAENREYVEGKGFDTANVDRRTEMLLRILGDMQQNNKISESTDFAAALYNAGVLGSLPMRRVAQAPFFVLRGAGMPAVLIEVGFVTNVEESRQLTQTSYQKRIAQAMASGISSYLK